MNIDHKKKLERRRGRIRWILYYLMLSIAYLYMTTSRIVDHMPLFLIPIALCVAMVEEPFASAVTGCAAGIMIDSAQGTLIGVNAILMLWVCLFASLLFAVVMRRHIFNILLLSLAATLIQGLLHYVFSYMIWDYDPDGKMLVREFLPPMAYTVLSTVFFYYVIKFLKNRLGAIKDSYLEEKSEDIVRE